uniref:septum formation family protein n=1 Tax=Salinibacterium sp. TaxID=1915057 RepID=UPI00286C0C28
DYSAPAVPADPPTTAMPPQYLPTPMSRPPMSMMARPPLPISPATELPATTVLSADSLSAGSLAAGSASARSMPPISSLPFDSLPPLPASALALSVPPNPVLPKPVPAHAMPRQQKILLGVAGGLVALLALVALFLLGTRIGVPAVPEAAVTPAVPPSTTPTVTPVTGTGPVAAGDHPFDELLGGECLTLYESPWQETYTVVDCGQPHPAQMLARATLPDAAGAAYPATADLQASTTLACTAATVIDYASAGEFDDIQISASFPPSSERWAGGDRTYYCFASRSGGGDLTGSIAIPAA